MSIGLRDRGVRVVLLDIEGTTTPIAFVHETLFPYSRARLGAWLAANSGTPDFVRLIEMLAAEHRAESSAADPPPSWREGSLTDTAASATEYLVWLMDRDRKSSALKLLQGWIWESGYQAGELCGQVYEDVPPAMRRWRAANIGIAIYSSGSELAQRRLFASIPDGDLTPLVAAFFDTAVGPKQSSASYERIVAALGLPAPAVLFVSDVARELEAARAAGCQVVLSVRPGNPVQPEADRFDVVTTFEDLI